jgi:hypothetical protein
MKEWVIYALAGVALLAVLFGLSFCSGVPNTTTTRSDNDLFTEALQEAQEYLKLSAAQCGEDYYILVGGGTLYQLKGPVAVPLKSKVLLTPADKLNHIEWRGEIMVMVLAHREYSEANKSWSSWMDGEPSIYRSKPMTGSWQPLDSSLIKQNGRWNIGNLDHLRVSKPDCSKIPAE